MIAPATSALPPTDTARSDPERRKWVLLLGALTALGPLAIDAYLPTMPTIQRELSTTAGAVQLTLSSYFVGLTVGQLIWGPLADRWGRRRPLLLGLTLYALGSACCALSPTVTLLALSRAIQALGGSAGVVVVRAVVRDRWTGRAAADVMSAIALVMGVAPILAPTLGGLALTHAHSWRVIFWALTGAALIMFFWARRVLVETHVPKDQPVSLLRAAREAVTDRRFVSYGIAASFGGAAMFAYIAGSPFVFVEILDVPPDRFAVFFGGNAAVYIVTTQVNRWLLRRYAHTAIAAVASLSATVVALVLFTIAALDRLTLLWAIATIFPFTASLALILANAIVAALEGQGERAGLASAVLGATQFAASASASAAVGIFADGTARPMAAVMAGCTALAVLGMVSARSGSARDGAPDAHVT